MKKHQAILRTGTRLFSVFLLLTILLASTTASASPISSLKNEVISFESVLDEKEMGLIGVRCNDVKIGVTSTRCLLTPTEKFQEALQRHLKGDSVPLVKLYESVGLKELEIANIMANLETYPVVKLDKIYKESGFFSVLDLATGSKEITLDFDEKIGLKSKWSVRLGFNSEVVATSTHLNATEASNQRKVVRSSDGSRVYVVYYNGNEVYFTQSDDDGNSWSSPLQISLEPENDRFPSIDINSEDGLHVVWVTNGSEDIVYSSCADSTADCTNIGGWTTPVLVLESSPDTWFTFPVIEIDSAGKAMVSDTNEDWMADTYKLLYSECSEDCSVAGNWSAEIDVFGIDAYNSPSITTDSDNNIHLFSIDYMDYNLLYGFCAGDTNCEDSANWGTVSFPNDISIGGYEYVSSVAFDENINLVSTYADWGTYDINLVFLTCSWSDHNCLLADSWTDYVDVNGGAEACYSSLVVDSDNNKYVFWDDPTLDSNPNVVYSKCLGGTDCSVMNNWGGFVPITNDSDYHTYPNAVAHAMPQGETMNCVDVIWTEGDPSIPPIDYNVNYQNLGCRALPSPPSNSVPGIEITKIDGHADNGSLPVFSYAADGNLTIAFNVLDADNDRLTADINYSLSGVPGTGTLIVSDLNLSIAEAGCADENFLDLTECSWDWNIFGVADANYYVLISVYDGTDTNSDVSDNNFGIDNMPPPDPFIRGLAVGFASNNNNINNMFLLMVSCVMIFFLFFWLVEE